MSLYHICPAWLEPGSIIRPGNYGRVLRYVGPNHNNWVREQFLEFVRQQEFPDKPSRLTSAFACEDLVTAQFFKSKFCETGLIYEVEMVDPAAKTHVTDFNCVQPVRGREPELEDIATVARHYWAASYWFKFNDRPDLRCAERVMDSALRIVAEAE